MMSDIISSLEHEWKMDNLAEKVWFVTGTSAGLGRALAERIVERGGRVFATARNKADVNDLAALGEARVATAELDVADPHIAS